MQTFFDDKIDQDSNDLAYPFSISLANEYIAQYDKYNVKIWWGNGSTEDDCDPVLAKGIAVWIQYAGPSGSLDGYVTLKITGVQTFLTKNREIAEYVPVSEFLNMQSEGTDASIVTKGNFDAFIGGEDDPDNAPINDHRWSNSFKGRSIASSTWELQIEDFSTDTDINWNNVRDIVIYMETMTSTLPDLL